MLFGALNHYLNGHNSRSRMSRIADELQPGVADWLRPNIGRYEYAVRSVTADALRYALSKWTC